MTLRVGILLTRHFTLNALANFVDVLRLAADEGDGSRPIRCQWRIMSATGSSIGSSCGIPVVPTSALLAPAALDYIAVIGGLIRAEPSIDPAARAYLLQASTSGVGLIGICTGTFVLCRLGLMNKRACCISWYHYRDFLDEFDDIEPQANELYAVDGNRITSSGGVGAALAAAHIVEAHLGDALARKALHIMQIDKARPCAKLQPAPPVSHECNEAAVKAALLLMEQNLSSPLSVCDLAGRLSLSARTLQRLFRKYFGHGPLTAYLHLRLRHAQWRLRAQVPIVDAAAETGFKTASAFSASYRRRYGCSPSAERAGLSSTTNSASPAQIEVNRRAF